SEESRAVLWRALHLGVNLIDTADVYTETVSEQVIGEMLAPYPNGVVIATKAGITISPSGGHGVNASPEHLRRAVEASLRRLWLDRIDLYFLHRVDPKVPLHESLAALKQMQEQGKLRHIGLSSVS